MINSWEVQETNEMIEKENLDVRTITLGISLLDCIDSDLDRLNQNIYNKITTVAKLESQVTEIKELPEKFNVGYSNAYKTKKSTRVAIIPCGYINGVDVQVGRDMFRTVDKIRYVVRDLKDMFKKQNHSVFINNQRCEILGRIGTFHVTVDITGKSAKCRCSDS